MIILQIRQLLCILGYICGITLYCSNAFAFERTNYYKIHSLLSEQTIFLATPKTADEENDADEYTEDFEEADSDENDSFEDEEPIESIDIEAITASSAKDSDFVISGFFKEDLAYTHASEYPDYSKIKSTLNLTLDWKLSEQWKFKGNWNGFYDYAYEREGREDFTNETLEAYESESEIRVFYLDGTLANQLYLKTGRQIITWGESSTSQITDMANPRYQRELAMVDLEDARLPVVATKLSALFGTLDLSFAVVHEIRGNKNAVKGSEFDPYASIRAAGVTVREEEVPDSSVKNSEFLFRAYKSLNGGDISLILADTYDDSPYLDFYELSYSGSTASLTLTPKHKRIKTAGLTGNLVSGSWLFKSEIAKKWNKALARSDYAEQISTLISQCYLTCQEDSEAVKMWSNKNVIEGMIGLEYSGISDFKIALEAAGDRIENYESNLSSKELSGMVTLIIDYSTWNDTLRVKLMAVRLSNDNGDVMRASFEYDIIDALTVSAGVIYYEADNSDALLIPYERNDKYYSSLKYSF